MEHNNTFVWNELLSKDVEKDRKFYTSVFDWTSEDKQFGNITYTVFKHNDQEVAGMMPAPEECSSETSMWLSYVAVEDIDAAIHKATDAGALKIPLQKMDIEGVGAIGMTIDASGALIGFFKPEEK